MEEDIQLIERIKAGDQKGFDALFRKYYKYLVVTAYQYVKDDHQAKDMVQEIFCDVWQRRTDVVIENPKAYLRRAVVNKCLANIRKNSKISYEDEMVTFDNSSRKFVDEEIDFNDANQLIKKVVESLPTRCKEIFKLSRFEQLSHKEIAERLDISVKTIENQMTKALKILRKELSEHGLLGLVALFFILL